VRDRGTGSGVIETETLVIGGGLTGLTVASGLAEEGRPVVVLEKSRGTGGRLATRRAGDLRFDHGAPYLRAEAAEFAAFLDRLRCAGAAAAWPSVAGGAGLVGRPGMSGLVKPLAGQVDVRAGTEVARAVREGAAWAVHDGSDKRIARARRLVSTIPAPQARTVLAGAPLAEALSRVRMAPIWTLMAAFDAPLDLPDLERREGAALAWLARDSSKPGRAARPETWVAQGSAEWSAAHLELDKLQAAARLLALLAERAGHALPEPVHAEAHRWRYALAATPLGEACLHHRETGLVIAGDWCLGGRAEDAYLSGLAALDALG